MKNLRIAKKNPSKILKIIEVPQTYRYTSQNQNPPFSNHMGDLAIGQYRDRQPKQLNFSTYRQKISRSPSNSQKIMQISSVQKHNKIKSKSLNRSEENIKNEEHNQLKPNTRQSIELKPRHELSPYIKRGKNRDNDRILNFHSVNLGQKKSLERESSNDSNRRRYSHLKIQRTREVQAEKKSQDEVLDNAKQLLNNGEYRKSLLLLKSVLKARPENVQGLYLSAVNWYHLQDRSKVHYFTEQIIQLNPSYSAECYKIKAVCYFKTLEYSKSLAYLKECHQRFPEQYESYELEGKVHMKMKKWKEALECYTKAYQFSKNVDLLGNIATCYEELNKLQQALQYYDIITRNKNVPTKYLLRKVKIHVKLQQYQLVVDLFEPFQSRIGQLMDLREKEQLYYYFTYAYYRLKKFSKALILIDEGLKYCEHEVTSTKFNRILLMIKIEERDIYEAFHISQRLQDAPQLLVIKRFIEGVINLMRRNYNQAINILFSIQKELGFNLEPVSRFSTRSPLDFEKVQYHQVDDEFLQQIRKIFLMFLSYAYYSISEFHSAKRLIELQREIGVSQYFELGLSYNYEMCLGIISHYDRRFRQAESHFNKAKAMYENKLEPTFSLALNYLQLLVNQTDEVQKLQIVEKVKGEFWTCKKIVGKTCSNTAASLYYFSSLLHGYLEEWKEALISIDISIERSEDHYWRYYYIRGMLLACIHSFKEAIGDLTAAISLSSNTKPECFLLRSKCLQIEGEGNEAFKDLQEYIALKPDDPEVHKYAGQLLFENGAFQDSLTAFHHQPIPKTLSNYDMFLTQGKSYFLLGKFKEAIQSLNVSYEIRASEELQFDIEVIKILDSMTTNGQPEQSRKKLEQIFGDFAKLGKIFKTTDFFVLKATCLILQEKYNQAVDPFLVAIKEKEKELMIADEEDEVGLIQNKKDLQTFANQMKYNIVICKLNADMFAEAVQILEQINIPFDQPYYPDFMHFKKFVTGDVQILKKQEVFPNRNKLSNFIPKIKLKVRAKAGDDKPTEVKLCIPFPKVQPPEIFPTFNLDLISKLSVMNVERKPQAPWILRENNSIKFTQKIETFSRLELEDSEFDSSSTFQIISVQNDHLSRKSSRSRRLHTSELGIDKSRKSKAKVYIS